MLPFLLIGSSLIVGVITYRLTLCIADASDESALISPRALPRNIESIAAAGLCLTLVGTVLAAAASIAPLTLCEQTGAFQFWWYVGFAPSTLLFISGAYDLARIVFPLKQSWKSWSVVLLSWFSGALFAAATWLSLHTPS